MTETAPLLTERAGDATPLAMFDRTVGELGDEPLLYTFETPLAARDVARLVDGLAVGLAGLGVGRGDRVALYLQNDPQFVIASFAAWRLGAIVVPCNPMLRERELAHHFRDAGVKALIALDELYESIARGVAGDLDIVVTTCADDLRGETGAQRGSGHGAHDLLTLAEANAGRSCGLAPPAPEDVAVLTYTSGTTGPPKGAMNTHANIAFASRVYRDWLGVDRHDKILAIAPLYHVTGLTAHIGLGVAAAAPIILAHRFEAPIAARLTEYHGATVTVAAITAFIAMANDERASRHDLSSLRWAYSGGAPIAPAVVDDLAERAGLQIRPVYGMTETTGPATLALPVGANPVDPSTGALSVGVPAPSTQVRILGEDGKPLPPGEIGEVAVRGPQVVPGYWGRPEETANAIRDGEMRTGDVGLLDDDGWLFLVDRRKDMIIASGFKVWPREVEDVLYEHSAVLEAAVVGVADSYRGETVWAYVALKVGCETDEAELVAHCRARLAAYKYPRVVHIVDELPKTSTGKILRRELRALAEQSS